MSNHPLLHRNIYTNDKIRKMARILCQNEYKKEGNIEYIFEDFEVMSDFEIHTLCDKMKSLRFFDESSFMSHFYFQESFI